MTATTRICYSMNSNLASIPETTKSWRWSTDHPESFASPSTCRTALASPDCLGCLGSQNGLVTPSRPWKGVRPKFAANFACLLHFATLCKSENTCFVSKRNWKILSYWTFLIFCRPCNFCKSTMLRAATARMQFTQTCSTVRFKKVMGTVLKSQMRHKRKPRTQPIGF
jgi:hypothetical protein